MPPEAPALTATQRWMQSAIIAPDPSPSRRTRRFVRPSARMSPDERIDVYRGMYEARLNEALRADYAGLVDLLGEDLFDELAGLYIREQPSRSYSLNGLGAGMAKFIERVDGLPQAAYAADLARLEWAMAEVFHEAETPVLDASAFAAVPADAWSGARLRPIAALRLLDLAHAPQRRLTAMRQDQPRPPKRRSRTSLAVYRRDFAVAWIEFEPAAARVFRRLYDGATLGEALRGVREPERAFVWFREWNTEGLFQAVELP